LGVDRKVQEITSKTPNKSAKTINANDSHFNQDLRLAA